MGTPNAYLFLLGLVLLGCGPRPSRTPTPQAEETTAAKDKPEKRIEEAISAKQITLEVVNEERLPSWNITAAQGFLDQYADDNVTTRLEKVTGRIFEGGKPSFDFSASRAFANRSTRRLKLEGEVVLTDLKGSAKMTSRAVQYWPESEMIEARGEVKIADNDYEVGPMPSLWTRSGFSIVGTYEALMKHPKSRAWMAALTATLLSPTALSQSTFNSKDKSISLQYRSGVLIPRAGGSVEFEVSGNPVKGNLKAQNLTFECKNIQGATEKGKRGQFIKTANASGDVLVNILTQDQQSRRTTTLNANSLKLNGTEASADVRLMGGIRIKSNLDTTQELTFTAASGNLKVDFDPGEKFPIESGTFQGKVTVILKDSTKNGLRSVIASSDTMNFKRGSQLTLEMIGNVKVTSEDDSFGGEVNASRILIILSPEGEVLRIEAVGDPGTGTYREKNP